MPSAVATPWNSLEVAKLAVSAVTPILLFVFGLVVARAGRRVEEATWANRKVVERRLELHALIAPMLNDIYCFMQTIGHFRLIDPTQLIQTKRDLDRIFFANEQLFNAEFGRKYRAFMQSCFLVWAVAGEDSKIRMDVAKLRAERGKMVPWDSTWDRLFEPSDSRLTEVQKRNYAAVMSAFAEQVGARAAKSGRLIDG